MQLRFSPHGAVWTALYLFFVLGPLFALLAGRLPPARDFWTEFAVATRLHRPGDDGPAVRPHGALPLRHRAVGRGCHLPLPPPDLADRGRPGGAHPLSSSPPGPRCSALSGAMDVPMGAVLATVASPALIAAGGDGPVACEAEDPLRDVAPEPHRAGGGGSRGRHRAHGRLELLPDRPAEARAVDRPDDVLDRAAVLRARDQAAVHAPPAVPRRGGAQGARRRDAPW